MPKKGLSAIILGGLLLGATLFRGKVTNGTTISGLLSNTKLKDNLQRTVNRVANMGQRTVVPLGINSKILAGTTSTAVRPIFMYNGSAYIQSGNSLQPVEPAYKAKRTNGTIVNAPLTPANWGLQGAKVPGAFNVSGVNYLSQNWARAPGPTTVLSNENAAKFLAEINKGQIKVPNVPLANIGMKPVNNAPAIPISSLPVQSQQVIQGTSLIRNLGPSINTIFEKLQKLRANSNFFAGLRNSNTRNLPKNMNSVNTYVQKWETCPAVTKIQRFLQALPVQTLNKPTLLNVNVNSNLINWGEVQRKAQLTSKELDFFKSIISDKQLMTSFNQTLLALPGANKQNTNTRRKIFGYTLGSIVGLMLTDIGPMVIYSMIGGPVGAAIVAAPVVAGAIGAGSAAAAGGASTAAVAVVVAKYATRAAVKKGATSLFPIPT